MTVLNVATLAFGAVAVATFFVLLLMDAPYGRHARTGWGPALSARTGWIAMELPALLVFPLTALLLGGIPGPAGRAFLLAWMTHYAYRTLIYPFTRGRRGTPVPIVIVLAGAAFNTINGILHGAWLAGPGSMRDASWLSDPRFLAGGILFLAGLALHARADGRLARLKTREAGGYSIPRGGAFELVSCPNYLGEIVEWAGWAVMTWSPPALAFAAWTAANLAPRALSHHRWYRARFPRYPARRRALIPWLL